jgi:hypothetical protein
VGQTFLAREAGGEPSYLPAPELPMIKTAARAQRPFGTS